MKCLAYFSQLNAAEKPVFPATLCKAAVIFTDAGSIFSLLSGGSCVGPLVMWDTKPPAHHRYFKK